MEKDYLSWLFVSEIVSNSRPNEVYFASRTIIYLCVDSIFDLTCVIAVDNFKLGFQRLTWARILFMIPSPCVLTKKFLYPCKKLIN